MSWFVKPQRAFGLLQVLGAMMIGLIVVTGSMVMMKVSQQSNETSRAKTDFDHYMEAVARAIEIKDTCRTMFQNGGAAISVPDYVDASDFILNTPTTHDDQAIPINRIVIGNLVLQEGVVLPGTVVQIIDITLESDAIRLRHRNSDIPGRFHYLHLKVTGRTVGDPTNSAQSRFIGGFQTFESSDMRFIVQVAGAGSQPIQFCHCRGWSDCGLAEGFRR